MNNHEDLTAMLYLKLRLPQLRRKKLLSSKFARPTRPYQRHILQKRPDLGKFNTLVSDLNSEPRDFCAYFRMDKESFQELLELVKKSRTKKKTCNAAKPQH